jgi:hypothetical protein
VCGHKAAFRAYLAGLAPSADVADQLMLLFEGATVTAAITGSPDAARQAKAAARLILAMTLHIDPQPDRTMR